MCCRHRPIFYYFYVKIDQKSPKFENFDFFIFFPSLLSPKRGAYLYILHNLTRIPLTPVAGSAGLWYLVEIIQPNTSFFFPCAELWPPAPPLKSAALAASEWLAGWQRRLAGCAGWLRWLADCAGWLHEKKVWTFFSWKKVQTFFLDFISTLPGSVEIEYPLLDPYSISTFSENVEIK